jgi:mono/diheme cytochrome c family protein
MGTNLKVFAIVIVTLLVYTGLANTIPQVQSEVPQELTFGSDVTTEQLVAAGDQLFHGAGGCTACHGLGTRAPNLLTDEGGTGAIGARCGTREPGKDCKQYLHESLVQPGVYVVAGYQPIMQDMSRTLSPAQIWSLVAYLESVGGEVTVTPYDVQTAVAEAGAAAPQGAQTSVPAIVRRLAAPEIDQIHDVMEGEERDAERQRDVEMPQRPVEQVTEIVGNEVRVLEHRQHGEVGDDRAGDEYGSLGRQIGARRQPVDGDRQDQQRDERRVPVAVEGERQEDKRGDPPLRMRIGNAVDDEGGRQEYQQERVVVEEHQPRASRLRRGHGMGSSLESNEASCVRPPLRRIARGETSDPNRE